MLLRVSLLKLSLEMDADGLISDVFYTCRIWGNA
jgi:hypothetical protein